MTSHKQTKAWSSKRESTRPSPGGFFSGGGVIVYVGPGAGPDAAAGPVARLGTGGVVSRPRLFGRLGASARVTVVSAPPGSGKTVLLRSWIGEAALSGRAAWVPVGRGERDPQQFWLLVLGALRQTAPGLELVQPVTAAPDLDGWVIVERLLTDLASLADRVWLVVDDVHELIADQALRQLELLIMRAPPQLRFVLATRHDVRLGCTGCGWRASWPRSASPICGSPWTRRGSCSPPPGCTCPDWRRWWTGPKAGRRGCGWRRCRWPGTRTRRGWRPSFPVPNGRWPNTCWLRCWTGRA